MTGEGGPLIGWRLWRLRDGRLHSWILNHVWEPGPNHADCLAVLPPPPMMSMVTSPHEHCARSPGVHCGCGLWALWQLPRCLTKARGERCGGGGSPVIGLVSGWGAVAVHGDEGFRCQHARILLLLSDSVWAPALDPLVEEGSLSTTVRLWLRLGRRACLPVDRLRQAASRYSVPLSSLRDAVTTGVLVEFGVPAPQVEEVSSALGAR